MKDESGYFRILGKDPEPNGFDLGFYCPGCECMHGINRPWQLTYKDGKPTVSPSILVRQPWKSNGLVCHLFIRDGRIEFLSDCTHKLAGKTVEMEMWED